MKHGIQAAAVGLFFLCGLALLYVVYTVVGNVQLTDSEGYRITARFNNLKTLTAGSDVRLAGVRIGSVEKTALDGGEAEAILRIQPGVEIPEDSVASIAMSSLLGQNYITLRYGEAGQYLEDGARVETEPSADFNDVIKQVGELGQKLNEIADSFSGLGGGDSESLFSNLNALVTENRSQFDSIVANLEALTARLNSTEGTIGKLINDREAYDELMTTVAEIEEAAGEARMMFADARRIVNRIDQGEGSLGKLINDDGLARELQVSVDNLREFSEKLNSGEGTLGKLVTDDELYRELRGMLQKADQALDSVGDSGPISAVGTAAGALF